MKLKRKCYDYSGFRLSRLKEPRFSHLLLLSGWLIYFALYFLTERLIPEERCHEIHIRLDDLIPFCELFVVPYVLWYVLVVGSLLWYLLFDVRRFREMQIFIMITQAGAMLVYILWPSIQNLRPESFPRENFFTWILSIIYSFDTPTGVFPSLHVAYSVGIASVWLKDDSAPRIWKGFVVFAAVLISAATAFTKQHSAADILGAIPLCLLAELLVYGKQWWLPRMKKHGKSS